VRIALKIAMQKSKENAKGALTLQINWSCAKPIKTCIRFRFAQTKLTASVRTCKTDKVQSLAPSNFFHFAGCS